MNFRILAASVGPRGRLLALLAATALAIPVAGEAQTPPPPAAPKKILRVTLPLGMQLVHGTRVIVDSNAPMQSPYVICFANGCMSDYEVTPELLANLKKGQNLVVQAINSNGAPLTLPLPLQETGGGGFAKAYDGPPTDPKVFEENQKKLQEELQKRAEEARKKLEATQGAGAAPAAKQ